eukprot:TRINITY_DN3405_c0_g1_i1.p1 TRINITY_DN3405_c0_g1~~TRINITY_DN3405_c0_g1_i1.p1  ORF type:complete len:350 (+),score=54.84 TRINITY_DN3405_c0_g1_i1:55-1104(+)
MAAPPAKRPRADAPLTPHPSHQSFLRPTLLMGDMSDHNLRLAAQVGATDIVAPYPGPGWEAMKGLRDRIASFGLRLCAIERLWPHDAIVHDKQGRVGQIEATKDLIRNMGRAGVPIFCYNWMPADDWSRTSVETPARGGSLVTAFDPEKACADLDKAAEGYRAKDGSVTSGEKLWETLESFLREVLPVAEEAGVDLALHPDDPPMPVFRGKPQIITDSHALLKAAQLVPSPRNGICFCQGTLASGGEDVVAAIRRTSKHIKYIHFRDVVGDVSAGGGGKFTETWHDLGRTDMVACMKEYHAQGIRDVPIRPDHVPTLDGETNEHPGYEMLGRLWAIGYMKGLMESAGHL